MRIGSFIVTWLVRRVPLKIEVIPIGELLRLNPKILTT